MTDIAYRQGDVILRKIDQIPEGVEPIPHTPLALGEVTGHKHQFGFEEKVRYFRDPKLEKAVAYLDIDGVPATLKHEEHGPITLPPGKYEVIIQREYDPNLHSRSVVD